MQLGYFCLVQLVLYLYCGQVKVVGGFLVCQCVFDEYVLVWLQVQVCQYDVEYVCVGFGLGLVEVGYVFDVDQVFEDVGQVYGCQNVFGIGVWCVCYQEFVFGQLVQCGQVVCVIVQVGVQVRQQVGFVQEVCGFDFVVVLQVGECCVVVQLVVMVQGDCFFFGEVEVGDDVGCY